jgi:hypothetical protein
VLLVQHQEMIEAVGCRYSLGWGGRERYAPSVLLSFLRSVVCLLLDLVLVRTRAGVARDVDLLALRHEVRVLRRRTKRNPWRSGDRTIRAVLRLGTPLPRGQPPPLTAEVVRHDRVGGLIHEYERAAA